MTKKEIMDNYAKEQGYKDWDWMVDCFVHGENTSKLLIHINEVTDLIQIELKERIKEGYYKDYHAEFDTLMDILIPLVE